MTQEQNDDVIPIEATTAKPMLQTNEEEILYIQVIQSGTEQAFFSSDLMRRIHSLKFHEN